MNSRRVLLPPKYHEMSCSGRLLVWSIAGALGESALILVTGPSHGVRMPWGALGSSTLTWFAIFLWTRSMLGLRLPERVLNAFRFVLGSVPVGLLMLSWSVWTATGSFLSIESARFFFRNARMVALYTVQTEPVRSLWLIVGILAVTALWALAMRSAAHGKARLGERGRRILVVWVLVGVLLSIVPLPEIPDTGTARGLWSPQPLSALFWDLAVGREALGDCLERSDLRRRLDESGVSSTQTSSVLWIAVESLRPDAVAMVHQGRAVMPTLQGLADSGLLFTRVWAASTHSDYSDVSALSSTYPLRSVRHHYYRKEDPWPRPVIWDVLARAGYRSALISAQNEGWGGMSNFLESDGLDYFWDSRTASHEGLATLTARGDEGFERAVQGVLRAGKVDDSVVVDRAMTWIKAQAGQRQPFFLAMNFQSSHFPYELGSGVAHPYEPWEFDFEPSFTWYPEASVETARNAYFNALTYIDAQIARLLEQLDHLGIAGDTIVVVYGENGEAFHEHGQVTHASDPFEAGLRVPVVIAGKGIHPSQVSYPTSLVDLPPTVLGLLGVRTSRSWQGLDVLRESIPPSERVLYFHNENPISRADGLIVGGRWKLWLDRDQGRFHRYDLLQDPEELHALKAFGGELDQRLESTLEDFRCRQLRYYGHPALSLYYDLPPVVSSLPVIP